jgi:hypothetical protein
MTIHDRSRTHPVTAHAFTLPIVREIPPFATPGRRSATEQRELVLWSLLTCPDRGRRDHNRTHGCG